MRQSWRPILSGASRSGAVEAIGGIERATRLDSHRAIEPGLSSGLAGRLLLECYLAEAGQLPAGVLVPTLARALRAIEQDVLAPGLFAGLAGVGWTLAHLRSRATAIRAGCGVGTKEAADGVYESQAIEILEHPDAVEDLLRQVDEALGEFVSTLAEPSEFDLISGTTGITVYALERSRGRAPIPLVDLCISRLLTTVDRSRGGARWYSPPEVLHRRSRARFETGHYDLGVAHGLPGVISVLASARQLGVRVHDVDAALGAAVSELLAHAVREPAPSRLPYHVGSGQTPISARLAWCYGDVGAATALLHASRCVDDERWRHEALLLAASGCRPGVVESSGEITGVRDAAICHGAAGVAHALNRLHQWTGDASVAAASASWFDRCLAFREEGSGVAGFRAHRSATADGYVADDFGFLEGAIGIALTLLAAISSIEPEWDIILALSGPRVPGTAVA